MKQARALEPFAKKAKSAAPLNLSSKPLIELLAGQHKKDPKWQIIINEPVEIDF
jgi:hypothetical protein